jgi:hypothetical protein
LRNTSGAPSRGRATGEENQNDTLDAPLLSRLYSGDRLMQGLIGWTEFGGFEFRQLQPAPFQLRAIHYRASF